MKKSFAIFVFIIAVVLFHFLYIILPNVYLNLGQKAYEKKNYIKAYKNLNKAIFLDSKNSNIRYYYIQTLIELKPTLQVQKEIYKISQLNLADSADLISDRKIAKWRNKIFFNIGDNYIERVPFNNKILRWDAEKFPLKVNIENNTSLPLPKYYEEEIKKAFLQWQFSTGELICFEFINNPKEAQILVKFNPLTKREDCTDNNCKYVMAFTAPFIKNDLLDKMEIVFYTPSNTGRPFEKEELHNIALHEIGHSLGIMGHSYNKKDLMYMETQQDSHFTKLRGDFRLIPPTDLNTLSLLYKLIPDITNTPLDKFNTSHQFFAPIIMGDNEQINSRKMLEAQNYINSAPEIPNGYIDLSASYLEIKQYNKAIDSLNKALMLSSNNNEKFLVYYDFAIIYAEIKDWESALNYANLAKKVKPSSDVDGLIAMLNYNLGNKKLAKKSYISSLQKNPDNIIDAVNLSKIYLKEFNLIQAGKTLNKLIKANPEAKNDSRVKSFSILTFLFK